MMQKKIGCRGMETKLAEMLLDPEGASVEVRAHFAECDVCQCELTEMRATMALLDGWEVTEPNPYFMTRMEARLKEERLADRRRPVAGWFARLRAGFAYGPEAHVRPLAAMALTVVLLVGGGAYLGVTGWEPPTAPGATAVVHDLQTMDKNAQLLDQLETLSASNESEF
jgi:hypothetical protein